MPPESGFHEKYRIKAQLCLLVFIVTLFHNFELVIKNVKGVIFFATEQNTIYKANLQVTVCNFPEEWNFENLCSADFLISKQLAGILLKSSLRTEHSSCLGCHYVC